MTPIVQRIHGSAALRTSNVNCLLSKTVARVDNRRAYPPGPMTYPAAIAVIAAAISHSAFRMLDGAISAKEGNRLSVLISEHLHLKVARGASQLHHKYGRSWDLSCEQQQKKEQKDIGEKQKTTNIKNIKKGVPHPTLAGRERGRTWHPGPS